MKIAITSIFFYLLIAFAIWHTNSLWPLFTLILSPVVMESLSSDDNKKDKEDSSEDSSDDNMQLNS